MALLKLMLLKMHKLVIQQKIDSGELGVPKGINYQFTGTMKINYEQKKPYRL